MYACKKLSSCYLRRQGACKGVTSVHACLFKIVLTAVQLVAKQADNRISNRGVHRAAKTVALGVSSQC